MSLAKTVEINVNVTIERTDKTGFYVVYRTGDGQLIKEERFNVGIGCTLHLTGVFAKLTLHHN